MVDRTDAQKLLNGCFMSQVVGDDMNMGLAETSWITSARLHELKR
jgi:hypothetical protein